MCVQELMEAVDVGSLGQGASAAGKHPEIRTPHHATYLHLYLCQSRRNREKNTHDVPTSHWCIVCRVDGQRVLREYRCLNK